MTSAFGIEHQVATAVHAAFAGLPSVRVITRRVGYGVTVQIDTLTNGQRSRSSEFRLTDTEVSNGHAARAAAAWRSDYDARRAA